MLASLVPFRPEGIQTNISISILNSAVPWPLRHHEHRERHLDELFVLVDSFLGAAQVVTSTESRGSTCMMVRPGVR
jgi:hypothetical protein